MGLWWDEGVHCPAGRAGEGFYADKAE
jgi:hypothetical protein